MRIIGALAQDSEIKHFENGMCVINFSIPFSEKYTNKKDERVERTTWVNCALWRKKEKLKIAEFLTKGVIVSCVGMPSVRAWINTTKNEAACVLEMRVEDLRLLTFNKKKPEDVVQSTATVSTETTAAENAFLSGPGVSAGPNDDLPF